jgi:hypothetical protein
MPPLSGPACQALDVERHAQGAVTVDRLLAPSAQVSALVGVAGERDGRGLRHRPRWAKRSREHRLKTEAAAYR